MKIPNRPSWMQCTPMGALYRFILALAWTFFKVTYRHRVYGWEHYRKGAGILACNHTSFFDPPIASISWPEEVHFLARSSLFKNPIFGALIRALHTHPVSGDVGDVKVFKTICEILGRGKKVILFPEGTRSRNGKLSVIKPGIALLVARTQAAVIPTYIHGAYEVFGKNRSFPRLFGKTACIYGTPILWENFSHLDRKQAQLALSAELAKALERLKGWYESGAVGTPP